MAKRKWHRPQLMVLMRGKSDEAVLLDCKTQISGGAGQDGSNGGCWIVNGVCEGCFALPDS